ncbi:hypothetical protein [Paracoccus aminophilus]|uniref:hypothetical protein n=1 Tax=Paracoccus aminophilus TaxID=34003 RepID=UPI00130D753A|nr:hypothetical protein [Paracoccus aminophilus]
MSPDQKSTEKQSPAQQEQNRSDDKTPKHADVPEKGQSKQADGNEQSKAQRS